MAPPLPVEHEDEPPPAKLPVNALPVTTGSPPAKAIAPPVPMLPVVAPPATLLVNVEFVIDAPPPSKIAPPVPCAKVVQPLALQPVVGHPLLALHPVFASNVSPVNETPPMPILNTA